MRKAVLFTFAAAAVALTASNRASAQPACKTLPDEPAGGDIPKLYIENGDTQEPMVKKMGKQLIKAAGGKLRIIYRNRPTCMIRVDMFTGEKMHTVMDGTTARPVKYIHVADAEDSSECTVPATQADPDAQAIQLGIGATYLTSCKEVLTQPPDLAVINGPVQAYGFITHPKSTQNGITAEEGYLAYGFPEGMGEASPWIEQALRFKRSNTASTSLTMAAAIRLKPEDMKAAPALVPETSAQLIKMVSESTNFEATLGILGMDLYDANRDVVKLLPFRSFGQRFAYYPDKKKGTFDKQNVRDGHYVPWAPTPYMGKKAADGTFSDAAAKRFFDLVLLNKEEADVNAIFQVAQSGLIPQCAMKVNRAGDGADLALYNDPHPCSCAYEKNVKDGATACTVCTTDAPCNGGKCRFGYCEKK